VSPTEGLRLFREDGGRINDGRWFDLYHATYAGEANTPAMLGRDPFSVPGPDELGVWEAGAGGKYAWTVQMTLRDRDTGLMFTQQVTHMSDVPVSAAQAQADMMADWTVPEDMSAYGVTTMGAIALRAWQTVPFGTG
jgi:hypothetical protein